MGFATAAVIIIDNETGVNYLFVNSGYAGGLTPLLDAKGNVIVTR
ncbi:MAG: xylan 1,4-beta-xylosidase [Bacteroidales bacterium]|nr:xylan 1,4-beta-xylosidase [Bacteroidales bacterium]